MNSNLIYCTDATPSLLGFFDLSIAPHLLFYSYIPIIFITLLLAIIVVIKDKFSLAGKLLLLIGVSFAVFLFNEIVLWVTVPIAAVSFSWALAPLLRIFILLSTLYFAYVFVEQRDLTFQYKLLAFVFSIPILVLLPTKYNVSGFDPDWCGGIDGPLWNYLYFLEITSILLLITWGIRKILQYKKTKDTQILKSVYLLFASGLFLGVYISSQVLGDITGLYQVNLIGPIGMLVFLIILTYLIVKFHAFNMRLFGAQALVIGIILLIGSQLFSPTSRADLAVSIITLIFSSVGGYFLIKSVKKEIEQREQIAKIAEDLRVANERLKVLDRAKTEFVSIASHQLRSPLTSILGYSSMLLEGSYGRISKKTLVVIERIKESSKFMALSVEDYLNVSRIEAGTMKYEMTDFSLTDTVEKVVEELRPVAVEKNLALEFRSECSGSSMIHADIGKTRQVIINLLDNAMKYTPKGGVNVLVHDNVEAKAIRVSIIDTGIGMSKETLSEVFDKFVRAKNANTVNVTGTGLGLYVAKRMVSGMGGKVWAESEGEGKGSTFHVEFPLV